MKESDKPLKPKKLTRIKQETVAVTEAVFGGLNVIHSKRTGLATGHTTTAVESAKRIEWVRAYASSHHLTPSRVVRILVNEAIDHRMRTRNV